MRGMQSPPIVFGDLRRALVIKLRHHGDVLLSSPVVSALKQAAPQCEIDALVYADTAPMLSEHPALTQLHSIDRNWKRLGIVRQAQAEWRLLAVLRARHYDLVVHLTDHPRGAWLVRLLRPRWAVAPQCPDRSARSWAASFTHQSPPALAGRHTVETHLDALRYLGLHIPEKSVPLTLISGREAEASVDARLAKHGLLPGSFIHIHPASRWLFKCWPADRFAALCDALAQEGWPLVLTAAPDPKEKAMVEEIIARRAVLSAPTFDFSGQLSLKELAALIARARLFVGVDSAPMHIAAAMGTPTVAIFGPSGDREWGPWNIASRIVTSTEHPCRPCGSDGCNGSKISECLTTLPVAQVLAACAEFLT